MKAPGCKNPVKFPTMFNGDVYRPTYWTDGKVEPRLPGDHPKLWKSSTEGVLFWTSQCKKIGEIEFHLFRSPYPAESFDCAHVEAPTEEDYIAAIGTEFTSSRLKERHLRTALWWLGNDAIRVGKASALPPLHLENLERLLALFSEKIPAQRLLKAEALRELSLFDEAIGMLEFDFKEKVAPTVSLVRELAANRDPLVAIVKSWIHSCPPGAHHYPVKLSRNQRRRLRRAQEKKAGM